MGTIFTLQTLIFVLIALAGSVCHVLKKWSKKEIEGTLADWWLVNKQASLASVFTVVGGVISLAAHGDLSNFNDALQVLVAWGIGYIGDSATNSQKVKP